MFYNLKQYLTLPQEFYFATDDRFAPSSASICDLFDKIYLNSEPPRENQFPRITDKPFNLRTEERGDERENL